MRKELWTENNDGKHIIYIEASSDKLEAKVIVDIIKTSSSNSFSNLEKENLNTPLQIGEGTGVRYKDNLILYRMNAQSRVIEEALLRENIPYRVIGGMKFYDRAEIKDLLAYLKVIHNGNDVVSMKRIINKPTRKIGDRTIEVVDNYREKFDKNYLQVIENIDEVSELNNGAKNALKSFLELYKHLLSVSKELVVADLIKEVLKATSYIEFITE
ncbi:MAG: hypothetical protein LBF15_00620 [Candidatus Peribacteria bacterium]|nr:hypothetical protein [Candidatus Peribacteria bacterium]